LITDSNPVWTTDDDDLPLSITHSRDMIFFDGKLEQDYRFLIYRFAAPDGVISARVYLDDMWQVSITEPLHIPALPDDVAAYLKKRFNVIKQLGGPEGYRIIWSKA
jgi:hypothetical protein